MIKVPLKRGFFMLWIFVLCDEMWKKIGKVYVTKEKILLMVTYMSDITRKRVA